MQPPSGPPPKRPRPTSRVSIPPAGQPGAPQGEKVRRKDRPDSLKKKVANEAARKGAVTALNAATGGTTAPVAGALVSVLGTDEKAKRNRRRIYILVGSLIMVWLILITTVVVTVLGMTLMGGGAGVAGTASPDDGTCLDVSAPRVTQGGPQGGRTAAAGTLGAPLDPQYMTITSGFGGRAAPTAGATSWHDGTDFSAPGIYGKPIYAPADGVVAKAGPADGYGNWVIIDHTINGQKVSTLYGHIENGHVKVKAGDHVKAGQHIADVGNAGASTGAHLHFGVYPGGWKSQGGVDPMPWLSKFKASAATQRAPPTTNNASDNSSGARQSPPGTVTAADWDALATLESGRNWKINSGNGFSGGVQFTASTWTANGGGRFAPQAWQATREQQMEIANNVLRTQGWGAWPPSARVPGLRTKKPAPAGTFVGRPAAPQRTSASTAEQLPKSPKGDERNLQAAAQRGMRLIAAQFPQVDRIGGYRGGRGAQDHGRGSAVDAMIADYRSPSGIALGDRIAQYFIDNAGQLNVKYILWRQRMWQGGSRSQLGDRGSDNENHNNHVHISFNQSGPPTSTVTGLTGSATPTSGEPDRGAPDGAQPYTPTGAQKSQKLTPEQQANIKAILSAAKRSGIRPSARAAVLAIAYAGAQSNFVSKVPSTTDPAMGIFSEVPLQGTDNQSQSNLITVPYAADRFFDHLTDYISRDPNWSTKKLADVLVALFPEQRTRALDYSSWEQLAISTATQLWNDKYSQANSLMQQVSSATEACQVGSSGRVLKPGSVPARFVKWITLAGQLCEGITAPLLAAQIKAESSFNEQASSGVADGSSQFTPATWQTWGKKVDENGKAIGPGGSGNVRNVADATMAQGHMMCADYANMKKLVASGRVKGDPIALTIAAYNAGLGAVLNAGGMPSGGDYTTQTQPYVARIMQWAKDFDGGAGQLAATEGTGGGRARVVQLAMAQRGKPYVWGAKGPDSFDCSGLVQWAYARTGIDIPGHTYAQMKLGIEVSLAQAQPGDMVFSNFSAPDKPEHVAMYIGNNKVVEAQQSGVPVLVSPMPRGNYIIKHLPDGYKGQKA